MADRKWLPGEKAFADALRAIVDAGPVSSSMPDPSKKIADALGVEYRTLRYWITGEKRCPAAALPIICNLAHNYSPLDVLETVAGRSAVPEQHRASVAAVKEIQVMIEEVGEALDHIGEALSDDIITAEELRDTSKELDDVIRQCRTVKHWLSEKYLRLKEG